MITLVGHSLGLAEFATFNVKVVRSFNPSQLGPRCDGYFIRTPEMNVPTVLPSDAEAIYIHARSTRGADLHLPLVRTPGTAFTRTLTTVAPERARVLERLEALVEVAEWTYAKTMPQCPHWYSRRDSWPSGDDDFTRTIREIHTWGARQRFNRSWWQVLHVGTWLVWGWWARPEHTDWLNGKPLPTRPEPPCDQLLHVENATVVGHGWGPLVSGATGEPCR